LASTQPIGISVRGSDNFDIRKGVIVGAEEFLSTSLADLFTTSLFADLSSAVRALRIWRLKREVRWRGAGPGKLG
jgi:hypothetical protein